MFAFMPKSVRRGFVGLSPPKPHGDTAAVFDSRGIRPYAILGLNLVSQLICVSGVNQLSSVCTFATDPPSLQFFFWTFYCAAVVQPRAWGVPCSSHRHSDSEVTDRSLINLFFCHHLLIYSLPLFFKFFFLDRECPRCQRKSYSQHARRSACVSACGGSVVAGTRSWQAAPSWYSPVHFGIPSFRRRRPRV